MKHRRTSTTNVLVRCLIDIINHLFALLTSKEAVRAWMGKEIPPTDHLSRQQIGKSKLGTAWTRSRQLSTISKQVNKQSVSRPAKICTEEKRRAQEADSA